MLVFAADLPCGVSVNLLYNDDIPVGSNLYWGVAVVNNTNTNITCQVKIHVDSLTYDGARIGNVASQITTNTLAPNTTNTVNMTITPIMYTNYTGATYTFEAIAWLDVEGQTNIWVDMGRITMETSTNVITVAPTPPIQLGYSLTGTVSYLNPLPISLHNVKVTMTADKGLSTNATIIDGSWDIGTIASNAWITVSTNYTAGQIGTNNIYVLITADELKEVVGNAQVEIVAP